MDWYVTEAVSYTEITLDDGAKIVVTDSLCWCDLQSCKPEDRKVLDDDCRKREPWDHDRVHLVVRKTSENLRNPLFQMVQDWNLGNIDRPVQQWESLKDGAKKSFHYALRQSESGEIDVDPLDLLHASSR